MKKKATFPFFRSVTAHMEERYIFNFLIEPDALAKKLPVPWLEPQVFNGYSVVSFCILFLKRLSVAPIPPLLPFETISSAYRIGVIDVSGARPEPSVYITERWANLPLVAKLAPWIVLDSIPIISVELEHVDRTTQVRMGYFDGTPLFTAQAKPAAAFSSQLFATVGDFSAFIKKGVSSYAPAIYGGAFTKVDLLKEDVGYQPMEATVGYSELHQLWDDVEMPLDSAVKATGARYKWTYRGLWSK